MTKQRVGIIGGGQLAWMMERGAKKLDLKLLVQTPHKYDPAVSIANEVIFADIDDAKATEKLAQNCDVITFENEFIDLDALQRLEKNGVCFRPKLSALSPLLDKYEQRSYLQQIDIPVPNFTTLENLSSFDFNFPLVVKARRHGYDGQGTFIINTERDLNTLSQGLKDVPLMVEEYIPFKKELAIMVARSITGDVVTYPVVETYQKEQVCRWVIAPANIPQIVQKDAKKIAAHLLTELEVVGIFGLELFLTSDDKLLVNEIAPRTHNSGHYTLDACDISQFEMQLRTVTENPLCKTDLNCLKAVMVNLLGYENSHDDYLEKRNKIANLPNTYVYWYGKKESRLGRKLGHVTVLIKDDKIDPETIAKNIEFIWYN